MARRSPAGEAAGRGRRPDAGFTYIGLLIAVALIGAALALVGQVWSTQAQREREVELLFRGNAIRAAIGAYLLQGPGGARKFPQQLEDLVQDPRWPQTKRYLRRVYEDPFTGAADWTLIRAADGGIMGVASSSKGTPIKLKGFPPADAGFEDAKCYCDWQFIFLVRGRYVAPIAKPTTAN